MGIFCVCVCVLQELLMYARFLQEKQANCIGLLLSKLQQLLECGSVKVSAACSSACTSSALGQPPAMMQREDRMQPVPELIRLQAGPLTRAGSVHSSSHSSSPLPFCTPGSSTHILGRMFIPAMYVWLWTQEQTGFWNLRQCLRWVPREFTSKEMLPDKPSPALPTPGQTPTQLHNCSLSFGLDSCGKIACEQSFCATQKGRMILQDPCTLRCCLWPTMCKWFHWHLGGSWLTAYWICCSTKTSGQSTLSPVSYTRVTAHHIFIWHLKQALHYLEDGFVQEWWHASKFDAFQHFCLVYMLPKWEKFGMTCLGFLKFGCLWQDENHFKLASNREMSCFVQALIKDNFCWTMKRSMVFIHNFE